jgi:hypothetical protein
MSKNTATGMSAFHGAGQDYTHECECGTLVTVYGSVCGPTTMCQECTDAMLAFIRGKPGAQFPPERLFPLDDANPVSCGNRGDLPKAQRRHDWRYLGLDTRHTEDVFTDLHIYACAVCGRDRQTRTPPQ